MATNGQVIGRTLSNGVQDISALLPLLGTEQCEDHVASALTKGYLYAAASPMSLFGSLGLARAGFKVFVSAISIPRLGIEGAKFLADVGFKPQGANMSLIMFDEERKSYCAEKQIDSMMKELHIEDANRITVSSKTMRWNIEMMLFSALFCIMSISPYIHLNIYRSNELNHFIRWTFPIMRAMGGFLTATMTQLVIQWRLLMIIQKCLILKGLQETDLKHLGIENNGKPADGEPAINKESLVWIHSFTPDQHCSVLEQCVRLKLRLDKLPHNYQTNNQHPFKKLVTWALPQCAISTVVPDIEISKQVPSNTSILSDRQETEKWLELQRQITEANGSFLSMLTSLALLFIGVIMSVAGYIGCFSAVQGSGSSREAFIWLGLELGLSIIRFVLWGLNPKRDDAPPLKFKFALDREPPFPTCIHDANLIEKRKELSLVRTAEFLKLITSYVGLLKQFSEPTLTLYYTLTRSPTNSSQFSKRRLYITIFDHTERTTRVYTQCDKKSLFFYSADPITVDLEHGILKTKLGQEIRDENDPIATNRLLRAQLAEHYNSILSKLNNRIRIGSHDIFENDWRLIFEGTTSLIQGNTDSREIQSEPTYEMKRDNAYLKLGELEAKVWNLLHTRGKWIENYMEWSSKDLKQKFEVMKELQIFEDDPVGVESKMELMLVVEQQMMERMLVDEFHAWGKKLTKRFDNMVENYMEKKTAKRRWRTYLWELFEEGQQAMSKRTITAKSNYKDILLINDQFENLKHLWQWYFEQSSQYLVKDRLKSRLSCSFLRSISLQNNKWNKWLKDRLEKTEWRLYSEAHDIDKRLERGLEHCHKFQIIDTGLLHSDQKWQYVHNLDDITALRRNPHVSHICVGYSNQMVTLNLLHDMPACTSIFSWVEIPHDIQLPPNILSISQYDMTYTHHSICENNQQVLEKTKRTTFEFANMDCHYHGSPLYSTDFGSFTVRFFGPSSGSLKLQLIHKCPFNSLMNVKMNGSSSTCSIPNTKSFEEIWIYNDGHTASGLVFKSNCRNILTFSTPKDYALYAIELVDEYEQPHHPD